MAGAKNTGIMRIRRHDCVWIFHGSASRCRIGRSNRDERRYNDLGGTRYSLVTGDLASLWTGTRGAQGLLNRDDGSILMIEKSIYCAGTG